MNQITLLVMTLVIKLMSRRNIFTDIKEKHGNETGRLCRRLEKSTGKFCKVNMDLDFLLTCKREKLIPTFARPKLSIGGDGRLRSKVAKLIIGTEIRNKHAKKKLLRKEINKIRKKLESELGLLTFYSLKYRISKEVEAKKQNWSSTHEKKLGNLRSGQEEAKTAWRGTKTKPLPSVIHNFSSYLLSDEEVQVLSKTLDHYIPAADS